MKVYTKKGDQGNTGLIGGTRVSKADDRIEAYGTVDELNSFVGLLKDLCPREPDRNFLKNIQDQLFTLGSQLAADPEASKMKLPEITLEEIEILEKSIDEMEEVLPPLTNFVLPGGYQPNSLAHICRTICRRAERQVVRLGQEKDKLVNLPYLNRLSDWFFVFSRKLSYDAHRIETLWNPKKT